MNTIAHFMARCRAIGFEVTDVEEIDFCPATQHDWQDDGTRALVSRNDGPIRILRARVLRSRYVKRELSRFIQRSTTHIEAHNEQLALIGNETRRARRTTTRVLSFVLFAPVA